MKRYTSLTLNGIYLLIIILSVLDASSTMEMKSDELKTAIYMGVMIGSLPVLIWNLIMLPGKVKITGTVFPLLVLLTVLIIGPLTIMFSLGTWKTDTIIYQSKTSSNRRVEYQMQDVGAFGYNRRTVEVLYLTKFFMITRDAEGRHYDNNWTYVNKQVNELGIKYP